MSSIERNSAEMLAEEYICTLQYRIVDPRRLFFFNKKIMHVGPYLMHVVYFFRDFFTKRSL